MYKPVTGNWDKMLHGKAASGTPRDPVQAPGLVDPAQYRRHHVETGPVGSEVASGQDQQASCSGNTAALEPVVMAGEPCCRASG